MTTFSNAVSKTNANAKTTTTNGMKTRVSSGKDVVDFFFKAGAMRGQDITPLFVKAMADDEDLALRVTQWLRDARGGAGEREHYRNILKRLEVQNHPMLESLIAKTPLIGRWDDLLVFQTKKYKDLAFTMIALGLQNPETTGLVCKWLPREKSAKGALARELIEFLGITPKQYRKTLSAVTTTETLMCAKEWEKINFSHVPSLASSRYRKAFLKNATAKYESYVQALTSGDASVKVNTEGLYPYQVTQNISHNLDTVSRQFLNAQWNALKNYVGDAKLLPMIDVSGSMMCPLGVNPMVKSKATSNITCMDVAVSLGMYLANKNLGSFKDTYLSFTSNPVLATLTGDIVDNWYTIKHKNVGYDTNIEKAFIKIVEVAVKNKVAQEEMPEYLVILSDMQMNSVTSGKSVYGVAKELYKKAGYALPKLIFWNLNSYDNVPVKFDKEGTALVSGFSPAIVEAVLSANLNEVKDITPYDVMLEAIMKDKYAL
jgi:hypothetical protein